MNIPASFHSMLAPDLRRYIALKQVLGRSFDTSRRIFLHLDRFLRGLGKASDLTPETFQKWYQTLESLSPNTRLVRMRAVRQFCLYRRRTVPDCFVPDSSQFPKACPVVRPYIFSNGDVAIRFVVKFAESYRRTEDLLLRGVLDGSVVHLDETKINILGGDQYVWVLTDNARVVFRLRPTRETDFLKPIFSTFKGTIVTDFYGGYDALPCRQQKCLVHLIRDLNDDLWKNPFDDEFEGFVAAVRELFVPILEDVRRFGLKSRHLGKNRSRVDRFYREKIVGQASVHDTIMRYRKRFERYKESLFAFIENDGIPWHNNAAERALRRLAVQRKISGAFSEQGALDYLRLLAIAQTCRFQRKSFLGFLRSKLISVDEYKERGKARPDWLTDSWGKE